MDLERYEVSPDILVTGEVSRMKDGFFHFEHQWLEGKDPTLELEQETTISGASLWDVDLRPPPYKFYERKRRRQARMLLERGSRLVPGYGGFGHPFSWS